MKVSYNWLKEYIPINIKPKEAADRLTMSGLEVKSIEQKGGDYIFEVEITSNRPDWLSVYGIARELQAITGLRLKAVQPILPRASGILKPIITIEDKKSCLKYVGRIIDGIHAGLSPRWLIERIESAGMRPVNDVVDITNFCLMELGQPLHAFDYDKIVSQLAGSPVSRLSVEPCIVVRRARKDEEITTIDGIRRKLDESILVIAADIAEQTGKLANRLTGKPIAIAGIMGGAASEVTFSTKRILLESAYFDPPTIRAAAKKLGLSTESSYRFERGVDIGAVLPASNRAAGLIYDLTKAKNISKVVEAGAKNPKEKKITLRVKNVNRILGTAVTPPRCASILKGLGLKIRLKGKDTLEVFIPSFRQDIKGEVDLIEEISRIYGYDKIPETLTSIPVWSSGGGNNPVAAFEAAVKETLCGMGLNEVITYSLIESNDPVNRISGIEDDKILRVQNPLSLESEVMRSSILSGLMNVLRRNAHRKMTDIRVFETGKSYFYGEGGVPSEKDMLSMVFCGMKIRDWQNKQAVCVFDLKGVIEALFDKFGIQGYEFKAASSVLFAPGESAVIIIDGKSAGICGRLSKELLESYDIRIPVFAGELEMDALRACVKPEQKFSEIPRFPAITRDISLVVEDRISNAEIVSLIRDVCGEYATSIKPFDLYRGEQIPAGSKSILYCVEYRASDKTLTDEEVNVFDIKVREELKRRFNATIR